MYTSCKESAVYTVFTVYKQEKYKWKVYNKNKQYKKTT